MELQVAVVFIPDAMSALAPKAGTIGLAAAARREYVFWLL